MDASGSILPLAYTVVDSEKDASWRWFFEQFKHAYGEKLNMCVISDRNESILKATSTVYIGMPHYACMWHIWTNVRSKFKNGHLKLSELELPVVELLEYMRTLLERWTNEKLLNAKGTFTYLEKKYNKELEDNMTLSQKVRALTDYIYIVIDGVKRFILNELLCAHALAALKHMNDSYENYCSSYYKRKSLLQTYEIPVDPLPDESKWNVPQHIAEEVVKLPTGKMQPGRPKNKDTNHMMK
ncbi:uncharacterized protein [Nicotiana tomentosiformis]|uniref:uncharacterized protein n=1 Tax=Nicotiana tomentosiformis TaxID=4098 RepID=UPI00388C6192